MAQTVIFHPHHGHGLCFATGYEEAPAGLTHPEHGKLVSCGLCGRYGVIPDQGCELEFLPEGTERAPGGGFILRQGKLDGPRRGGERGPCCMRTTGERARMPRWCSGYQNIAARLHPHG